MKNWLYASNFSKIEGQTYCLLEGYTETGYYVFNLKKLKRKKPLSIIRNGFLVSAI